MFIFSTIIRADKFVLHRQNIFWKKNATLTETDHYRYLYQWPDDGGKRLRGTDANIATATLR